jgi:hypothetical protein
MTSNPIHRISTKGARRVWPVSRGCLFFLGTWSYLWCYQGIGGSRGGGSGGRNPPFFRKFCLNRVKITHFESGTPLWKPKIIVEPPLWKLILMVEPPLSKIAGSTTAGVRVSLFLTADCSVYLIFTHWYWLRIVLLLILTHSFWNRALGGYEPVGKGWLLLLDTWSYLRICQGFALPYTRFCISFLVYDYVLHNDSFVILYFYIITL